MKMLRIYGNWSRTNELFKVVGMADFTLTYSDINWLKSMGYTFLRAN